MKTTLLFIILFVEITFCNAQMMDVQYLSNGSLQASNCPEISSQVYNYWEVFQTEDNTFSGIQIPEFCGGVVQNGLTYSNADINKAIYVRYIGPLDDLESYNVYTPSIDPSLWHLDFENFELCSEGICQGFIVKIQVSDDPNDVDDLPEYRTHFLEAVETDYGVNFPCFSAENLDEQIIVDFIIKIIPQIQDETLPFYYAGIASTNDIEEVTTSFLNDQIIDNNINLYSYYYPYVVMHDLLTFPSNDNITYAEVSSDIDNTVQQDITISFYQGTSLVFQPFTGIRGSLIEGSETERHHVIIQLEGANVCLTEWFEEMILHPGDELAITKANLMMNHSSCIRIEKDATLRINENSHFDYGYNGEGMIALNSGSSLILEKNASIEFNSIFSMWENPWEETPSNIEIYVNPGNKLVFGKYSSIANKSIDNRMKLVIHANGGLVDLSGLSDADLENVIVIYPSQTNDLEILQCTSLTSDGSIFTAIHCTQEGKANYVITDMSGREIEKGEIKMNSGYNTFHFNLPSSSPDAVILSINQNKSQVSRKLVLVD